MSKISQYPDATTLTNVKLLGNQSNVTKQIPATLFQPASTVKVWRGLISQTGTDAPTAIVLEDTIDDKDFVFSRSDVGEYALTDSGQPFTSNKTFIMITATDVKFYIGRTSGTDTITIKTYDASGAATDEVLTNTPLQILVYP